MIHVIAIVRQLIRITKWLNHVLLVSKFLSVTFQYYSCESIPGGACSEEKFSNVSCLCLYYIYLYNCFLIKNPPGVKNEWPTTKTGLAEKDVKSNGQSRPPGFDGFIFGHDKLTAKHWYFRCSRLPDVDGVKIFGKDDQAAKHCSFILMFCGLVIFIKKFWFHQHHRPWAPEITFGSKFIMTKTYKPIKTRRYWPPIWFPILFSKVCFISWPLLF